MNKILESSSSAKVPFHYSMKGRLLLYLLLPALLIFAIAFYYLGQRALNLAITHAKTELIQQAEIIAIDLERQNLLALNTARNMALAQQNGLFGNREASSQFAKTILAENAWLVGAYFGYEPNADQDDRAFMNSTTPELLAALDADGRFLPYWHLDLNTPSNLRLESLKDWATNEYYQGPRGHALNKSSILGTITEPYLYEGVQLIEFTYPIVIDQHFKGIAGVDIALKSIKDYIPKLDDSSDLVLLSSRQQIIATTQSADLLTRPVEETPYQKIVAALSTSNTSIINMVYDVEPERIYTVIKLPVSQWQLIIGRDKATVLAPIYADFTRMFLLVLFAFASVIMAALWFANKLSLRLNSAVTVLEELTVGELTPNLIEHKGCKDEIGKMYTSFQRLITASQSFEEQCRRISEGDFSFRVIARGKTDRLANAINTVADKRQHAEESLRQQTEQLLLTQQELVESEKMASLGNLVAGVAHEVNTPLGISVTASTHLQSVIDQLQEKLTAATLKRTDLEVALGELQDGSKLLISNLQRASDLVTSFKSVAVDQSIGEQRSIYLSQYLEEVVKSFTHQLKKTATRVKIQSGKPEQPLLTEPGTIAQIFSNLIMNSIIHGFKKGSVPGEISCNIKDLPDSIEICYQDNGVGMSAETQKRIFEPFYTTNRTEGGSGLGMHIVYNLVTHKLKGKIHCQSESGVGTTFSIKLPRFNSNTLQRDNIA